MPTGGKTTKSGDKPAPSKKRKQMTLDQITTIEEALAFLRAKYPPFVRTMDELKTCEWIKSEANVLKLDGAHYKEAYEAENTHYLPAALRPFVTIRDEFGRIVRVQDPGNGTHISGSGIKVIRAFEAAMAHQPEFIAYEIKGDHVGMLVIPGQVQIEEREEQVKDSTLRTVFTATSFKKRSDVYCSPSSVVSVLQSPLVTLSVLPRLVSLLSAVTKVGDTVLDADLASLESLIITINRDDTKQKKANFLSIMMDAALETATIEERINAFAKVPDTKIAFNLKIPALYSANLVNESDKTVYPQIPLSDVAEGQAVMFSRASLSAADISKVSGDILTTRVYVYSDQVGVYRKKKYHSVTENTQAVSKHATILLLTSLATLNTSDRKPAATAAAPPGDGNEGESKAIDF